MSDERLEAIKATFPRALSRKDVAWLIDEVDRLLVAERLVKKMYQAADCPGNNEVYITNVTVEMDDDEWAYLTAILAAEKGTP